MPVEVLEPFQAKYKRFISRLRQDAHLYLSVVRLPRPVRKHFKSTNIVESVNRILERLRVTHNGFWNSKDALLATTYARTKRLSTKWQKPNPRLASNLPLLLLLFDSQYPDHHDANTSEVLP